MYVYVESIAFFAVEKYINFRSSTFYNKESQRETSIIYKITYRSVIPSSSHNMVTVFGCGQKLQSIGLFQPLNWRNMTTALMLAEIHTFGSGQSKAGVATRDRFLLRNNFWERIRRIKWGAACR